MTSRDLLIVGLLSSCGPFQPKDTHDTGFYLCDAVSTIALETPSGAQDWEIPFVLANPDSEPADVVFHWTADGGETWHEATIEGETTDLATNPKGLAHTVTWKTLEDFACETVDGVTLELVTRSKCGLWPKEFADGLSIGNGSLPQPVCAITLQTPSGPVDGDLTLQYTTAHPDAAPVWVDVTWSADGGKTWEDMAWLSEDCDDDDQPDGLTDRATSAEGVEHCLVWQSEEDVEIDQDVQVRMTCGVGFDEQDEAISDTFSIENDPTPGEGEILIDELLPLSSLTAGDYLEITNRTHHTLDLEGVEVGRWRAGSSTSGPPSTSFTIHDVTKTVLVDAGGLLLLAGTEDRALNGCIDPDVTWGSFSLNDNSTLRLTLDDAVLAELSILDSAGWSFEEGVAMGLDPDLASGDDWNLSKSWCNQNSHIASCSSSSATDDGTPGRVNDPCR